MLISWRNADGQIQPGGTDQHDERLERWSHFAALPATYGGGGPAGSPAELRLGEAGASPRFGEECTTNHMYTIQQKCSHGRTAP